MRRSHKLSSVSWRALAAVRAALLAALAVLTLCGCASQTAMFDNWMPYISQFGVYKIDVNQGNFISQDMVDKLKEGQTKQQVRLVLGTPLINSAFRDNRWAYLYEHRKNGRLQTRPHFTLHLQGQ